VLYVTTRSNADAYTPHRILLEKRGGDGGLYVPFHHPRFTEDDLNHFAQMGFNSCVAALLNLQFNTRLTSWDVDFAVGRYPVRLKKLSQKIVIGECWHNPQWIFRPMAEHLADMVRSDRENADYGDWVSIAVRIAVLFGIYGELNRAGIADSEHPFDVSLVSGDFTGPISAWYARKWGLPVGNVVCCCNENSDIWNLFCHGQLRTDGVAVKTCLPDADVILPESLERLIHAVGGTEEAARYASCVRKGSTYFVEDDFLQTLRKGIFVSVINEHRIHSAIPNMFGSTGYVLSANDALACTGLLDYRSRAGENRYALVLSERAPVTQLETVSRALKITPEELKRYLDKT